MLVKDKMVSPAISVNSETTVNDALKIMNENNISRLPILNQEKLAGIVVVQDIDRSLKSPGFMPEVAVEWIMTPNPITIDAEADIRDAVKLLVDNKVAGLPVMSGDKVVGIITERDLLKYLLEIIS